MGSQRVAGALVVGLDLENALEPHDAFLGSAVLQQHRADRVAEFHVAWIVDDAAHEMLHRGRRCLGPGGELEMLACRPAHDLQGPGVRQAQILFMGAPCHGGLQPRDRFRGATMGGIELSDGEPGFVVVRLQREHPHVGLACLLAFSQRVEAHAQSEQSVGVVGLADEILAIQADRATIVAAFAQGPGQVQSHVVPPRRQGQRAAEGVGSFGPGSLM